MNEAVEAGALLARLLQRLADDHEGAGQDLEVIAIAAERFHAALHVGVEARPSASRERAAEHDLGGLRGELTPRL